MTRESPPCFAQPPKHSFYALHCKLHSSWRLERLHAILVATEAVANDGGRFSRRQETGRKTTAAFDESGITGESCPARVRGSIHLGPGVDVGDAPLRTH